ncbi:hypothetical protein HS088_TW19G00907 [Tripterygium wilfordii]|uniref:Rhodanese domain-containing protein n=1 Tax=Tripterygium wilfordii TaxID=458696 RepID=A0A7J7CB35_TRIWF|nr:hypothetical protein HS088_TW19G00907 [Tripterygium wilfordii]
MALLTSITQHPSSSFSLHPNLHTSLLLISSSKTTLHNRFCSTVKPLSQRSSSSHTIQRGWKIQCAATKPAKSPGVESTLNKDAKIIVACSAGGTMKPSQNLPEGQQSRSLIAAYLLVLNGYKNVFHLEGGLYTWFKEELPTISDE